jgi:tetratricopeptide (TPR) repeat protein
VLSGVLAAALAGQVRAQDALQRGYDAERRGASQQAADFYREHLAQKPGEVAAVVGLERSLSTLGKLREIVGPLQAALGAQPANVTLLALGVRAYAAADLPDSAWAMATRWSTVEPDSDAPWRELGLSLLQRRDRPGARAAFLAGRQKLGVAEALAGELAQVHALDGEWTASAREWMLAMRRIPGYRQSAASSLSQAPAAQRPAVLDLLDGASMLEPKRVAADLRVRWGNPDEAVARLERVLPEDRQLALDALRSLAELLRVQPGREPKRALGRTLERIAERAAAMQSARVRLDAAQAYADGGARADARRLLDAVAGDASAPPDLITQAEIQLIGVLVDDGRVAEAERRLAAYRASATVDEYLVLLRKVAVGHARAGRFGKADSILAADSTVEGMALLGRVKLWEGDLALAVSLLQQAGPFAGTREEAAARTQVFALLQGIERDSLPELGAALLALDTGDTAQAITRLDALVTALTIPKGGGETRVLLGRLLASRGDNAGAERQFRAVLVPESEAVGAAAALELGRLLVAEGRRDEAVTVLESMILGHPSSALVPLARRALEEARGAVPPS